MIYTGLGRLGEISDIKAHGGADVAEVYGGINESNPIYYKAITIKGTSPLTFKGLGLSLKDYCIYGNTVQDGTPTPDNPVDVVGCGERTAQLIPEIVQGGVSTIDGLLSDSSNRVRTNYISVESGKTYTVSSGNLYLATGCYYNNGVFSRKINEVVNITTSATFIVPKNVNQIAIGFRNADGETNITPSDLQSYMLNEGSTALPYEPYGYKLPLTVNSTEYPIYLGNVQTTRRIRKLVLTGDEIWLVNQNTKVFYCDISQALLVDDVLTSACTHYVASKNKSNYAYLSNNSCCIRWNVSTLWIRDIARSDVDDFKSYLATQYANGTPVTVWYVLAEPETAVVNEPLMKIGTYADTVSMTQSGVAIPTVAGANTLTVDTTVQPSAVSITGNIKEVST